MRSLPVLALALLLATPGCSGFGEPQDSRLTVAPGLQSTPTATPTPISDNPLPPGVTPGADDEVDERTLYVAHDRVLENHSVTVRHQQFWTNANGTVLRWSTLIVWTNGSRQRYEAETGGADPGAIRTSGLEVDFWTNGSVTVWRQSPSNEPVEQRVIDGDPPGSFANVGTGRLFLEHVLTGNDLQYVGVEHRNDTALHVLAGTTDNSRLTLRVTPDGRVRSFVLRTRTQVDGGEATIVRRFRVYDVGTTTVEKPAWAENATEP